MNNLESGTMPLKLISVDEYLNYPFEIFQKIDGTYLGIVNEKVCFQGIDDEGIIKKIKECIEKMAIIEIETGGYYGA